MPFAGGLADVDGLTAGRRFPVRDVPNEIPDQQIGGRIAFGPSGHVHLAEYHKSLAFAVFHERAVLKAIPAVEDRQEISLRRFLDQDGRDVSPAPAPPDAGDVEPAPLDDRRGLVVRRTDRVAQARGQDRRVAAPVAQALDVKFLEQRMIGHPGENLPQSIFGDAKAKPLFEDLAGLLEDDQLEPIAHVVDVGARAVEGKRILPITRIPSLPISAFALIRWWGMPRVPSSRSVSPLGSKTAMSGRPETAPASASHSV